MEQKQKPGRPCREQSPELENSVYPQFPRYVPIENDTRTAEQQSFGNRKAKGLKHPLTGHSRGRPVVFGGQALSRREEPVVEAVGSDEDEESDGPYEPSSSDDETSDETDNEDGENNNGSDEEADVEEAVSVSPVVTEC